MKFRFYFLVTAAMAMLATGTATADVFIAGVNGSMSVGGSTTTLEGSSFGPGGSAPRWENAGVVGTDYVATTTTVSADRYLIATTSLADLNLAIEDNRYVEVFYSISSAFTQGGAADIDDNRFFLSDSGQGNNGENPQDTTLIPATAGAHSFVLDLLSSDGITIDDDFTPGETWDQLRWDMWNNNDNLNANAGIEFTLDRVVYGNALVAIPEPGSIAMLAFGSVALLLQRRRKQA